MLSQRVAAQQQVLHILEVATRFRQAIYRQGRAHIAFCCFRAERFQHRGQRIITATTRQVASSAYCFFKTGSRINGCGLGRIRTQILSQRVGA